ncbi:hypothetical protein [uncultured Hymenobacter sp.]|uniref:hypothetical protein n=1 Tax=uncultured Hymenobacter sp. TaxID=170016 RepID=UPI0035CA339D
MFLKLSLVFSVLLLAACHDSPPKESASTTTRRTPAPLPDSILAAQRAGRAYVLDTMAIVTNRRLDTLLRLAEDRALISYASAQAMPPVVAAFFQARGSVDSPFVLADVGAPFEKGDAILDPNLPTRQLVYLGVSPGLVLVSYYRGGVGLSQSVVLFRLQGQTIQDLWHGYVWDDAKTKAELLLQVRQSQEKLIRRELNNGGGLIF